MENFRTTRVEISKNVKLILCGTSLCIQNIPNNIDSAVVFTASVPIYSGSADNPQTTMQQREFKVWVNCNHIMFHFTGQLGYTAIPMELANSMLGNLTGIIRFEIN